MIDDSLGVAQGVFPDTGRDHLDGGVGDDRLDAVDEVGGNDTLGGGPGTDVCLADVGDAIVVQAVTGSSGTGSA